MKNNHSHSSTNFIRHHELFYDIVSSVDTITSTHIGLYLSLFRAWNNHFFQNPFPASRDQLLMYSGFKSKTVFYKTIRELETFDLIRYYPASSIYERSLFCISTLHKENDVVSISVWGVSKLNSLDKTFYKSGAEININNNLKPNNLRILSSKFKGRGELVLLKKYALFNDARINDDATISSPNLNAFNPLTDPKYTSDLTDPLPSPSNNNHHAINKNPKQSHSTLRPSGIPPDPNADYSKGL